MRTVLLTSNTPPLSPSPHQNKNTTTTDDWAGWQVPVAFDENDCPLPPSDDAVAANKSTRPGQPSAAKGGAETSSAGAGATGTAAGNKRQAHKVGLYKLRIQL